MNDDDELTKSINESISPQYFGCDDKSTYPYHTNNSDSAELFQSTANALQQLQTPQLSSNNRHTQNQSHNNVHFMQDSQHNLHFPQSITVDQYNPFISSQFPLTQSVDTFFDNIITPQHDTPTKSLKKSPIKTPTRNPYSLFHLDTQQSNHEFTISASNPFTDCLFDTDITQNIGTECHWAASFTQSGLLGTSSSRVINSPTSKTIDHNDESSQLNHTMNDNVDDNQHKELHVTTSDRISAPLQLFSKGTTILKNQTPLPPPVTDLFAKASTLHNNHTQSTRMNLFAKASSFLQEDKAPVTSAVEESTNSPTLITTTLPPKADENNESTSDDGQGSSNFFRSASLYKQRDTPIPAQSSANLFVTARNLGKFDDMDSTTPSKTSGLSNLFEKASKLKQNSANNEAVQNVTKNVESCANLSQLSSVTNQSIDQPPPLALFTKASKIHNNHSNSPITPATTDIPILPNVTNLFSSASAIKRETTSHILNKDISATNPPAPTSFSLFTSARSINKEQAPQLLYKTPHTSSSSKLGTSAFSSPPRDDTLPLPPAKPLKTTALPLKKVLLGPPITPKQPLPGNLLAVKTPLQKGTPVQRRLDANALLTPGGSKMTGMGTRASFPQSGPTVVKKAKVDAEPEYTARELTQPYNRTQYPPPFLSSLVFKDPNHIEHSAQRVLHNDILHQFYEITLNSSTLLIYERYLQVSHQQVQNKLLSLSDLPVFPAILTSCQIHDHPDIMMFTNITGQCAMDINTAIQLQVQREEQLANKLQEEKDNALLKRNMHRSTTNQLPTSVPRTNIAATKNIHPQTDIPRYINTGVYSPTAEAEEYAKLPSYEDAMRHKLSNLILSTGKTFQIPQKLKNMDNQRNDESTVLTFDDLSIQRRSLLFSEQLPKTTYQHNLLECWWRGNYLSFVEIDDILILSPKNPLLLLNESTLVPTKPSIYTKPKKVILQADTQDQEFLSIKPDKAIKPFYFYHWDESTIDSTLSCATNHNPISSLNDVPYFLVESQLLREYINSYTKIYLSHNNDKLTHFHQQNLEKWKDPENHKNFVKLHIRYKFTTFLLPPPFLQLEHIPHYSVLFKTFPSSLFISQISQYSLDIEYNRQNFSQLIHHDLAKSSNLGENISIINDITQIDDILNNNSNIDSLKIKLRQVNLITSMKDMTVELQTFFLFHYSSMYRNKTPQFPQFLGYNSKTSSKIDNITPFLSPEIISHPQLQKLTYITATHILYLFKKAMKIVKHVSNLHWFSYHLRLTISDQIHSLLHTLQSPGTSTSKQISGRKPLNLQQTTFPHIITAIMHRYNREQWVLERSPLDLLIQSDIAPIFPQNLRIVSVSPPTMLFYQDLSPLERKRPVVYKDFETIYDYALDSCTEKTNWIIWLSQLRQTLRKTLISNNISVDQHIDSPNNIENRTPNYPQNLSQQHPQQLKQQETIDDHDFHSIPSDFPNIFPISCDYSIIYIIHNYLIAGKHQLQALYAVLELLRVYRAMLIHHVGTTVSQNSSITSSADPNHHVSSLLLLRRLDIAPIQPYLFSTTDGHLHTHLQTDVVLRIQWLRTWIVYTYGMIFRTMWAVVHVETVFHFLFDHNAIRNVANMISRNEHRQPDRAAKDVTHSFRYWEIQCESEPFRNLPKSQPFDKMDDENAFDSYRSSYELNEPLLQRSYISSYKSQPPLSSATILTTSSMRDVAIKKSSADSINQLYTPQEPRQSEESDKSPTDPATPQLSIPLTKLHDPLFATLFQTTTEPVLQYEHVPLPRESGNTPTKPQAKKLANPHDNENEDSDFKGKLFTGTMKQFDDGVVPLETAYLSPLDSYPLSYCLFAYNEYRMFAESISDRDERDKLKINRSTSQNKVDRLAILKNISHQIKQIGELLSFSTRVLPFLRQRSTSVSYIANTMSFESLLLMLLPSLIHSLYQNVLLQYGPYYNQFVYNYEHLGDGENMKEQYNSDFTSLFSQINNYYIISLTNAKLCSHYTKSLQFQLDRISVDNFETHHISQTFANLGRSYHQWLFSALQRSFEAMIEALDTDLENRHSSQPTRHKSHSHPNPFLDLDSDAVKSLPNGSEGKVCVLCRAVCTKRSAGVMQLQFTDLYNINVAPDRYLPPRTPHTLIPKDYVITNSLSRAFLCTYNTTTPYQFPKLFYTPDFFKTFSHSTHLTFQKNLINPRLPYKLGFPFPYKAFMSEKLHHLGSSYYFIPKLLSNVHPLGGSVPFTRVIVAAILNTPQNPLYLNNDTDQIITTEAYHEILSIYDEIAASRQVYGISNGNNDDIDNNNFDSPDDEILSNSFVEIKIVLLLSLPDFVLIPFVMNFPSDGSVIVGDVIELWDVIVKYNMMPLFITNELLHWINATKPQSPTDFESDYEDNHFDDLNERIIDVNVTKDISMRIDRRKIGQSHVHPYTSALATAKQLTLHTKHLIAIEQITQRFPTYTNNNLLDRTPIYIDICAMHSSIPISHDQYRTERAISPILAQYIKSIAFFEQHISPYNITSPHIPPLLNHEIVEESRLNQKNIMKLSPYVLRQSKFTRFTTICNIYATVPVISKKTRVNLNQVMSVTTLGPSSTSIVLKQLNTSLCTTPNPPPFQPKRITHREHILSLVKPYLGHIYTQLELTQDHFVPILSLFSDPQNSNMDNITITSRNTKQYDQYQPLLFSMTKQSQFPMIAQHSSISVVGIPVPVRSDELTHNVLKTPPLILTDGSNHFIHLIYPQHQYNLLFSQQNAELMGAKKLFTLFDEINRHENEKFLKNSEQIHHSTLAANSKQSSQIKALKNNISITTPVKSSLYPPNNHTLQSIATNSTKKASPFKNLKIQGKTATPTNAIAVKNVLVATYETSKSTTPNRPQKSSTRSTFPLKTTPLVLVNNVTYSHSLNNHHFCTVNGLTRFNNPQHSNLLNQNMAPKLSSAPLYQQNMFIMAMSPFNKHPISPQMYEYFTNPQMFDINGAFVTELSSFFGLFDEYYHILEVYDRQPLYNLSQFTTIKYAETISQTLTFILKRHIDRNGFSSLAQNVSHTTAGFNSTISSNIPRVSGTSMSKYAQTIPTTESNVISHSTNHLITQNIFNQLMNTKNEIRSLFGHTQHQLHSSLNPLKKIVHAVFPYLITPSLSTWLYSINTQIDHNSSVPNSFVMLPVLSSESTFIKYITLSLLNTDINSTHPLLQKYDNQSFQLVHTIVLKNITTLLSGHNLNTQEYGAPNFTKKPSYHGVLYIKHLNVLAHLINTFAIVLQNSRLNFSLSLNNDSSDIEFGPFCLGTSMNLEKNANIPVKDLTRNFDHDIDMTCTFITKMLLEESMGLIHPTTSQDHPSLNRDGYDEYQRLSILGVTSDEIKEYKLKQDIINQNNSNSTSAQLEQNIMKDTICSVISYFKQFPDLLTPYTPPSSLVRKPLTNYGILTKNETNTPLTPCSHTSLSIPLCTPSSLSNLISTSPFSASTSHSSPKHLPDQSMISRQSSISLLSLLNASTSSALSLDSGRIVKKPYGNPTNNSNDDVDLIADSDDDSNDININAILNLPVKDMSKITNSMEILDDSTSPSKKRKSMTGDIPDDQISNNLDNTMTQVITRPLHIILLELLPFNNNSSIINSSETICHLNNSVPYSNNHSVTDDSKVTYLAKILTNLLFVILRFALPSLRCYQESSQSVIDDNQLCQDQKQPYTIVSRGILLEKRAWFSLSQLISLLIQPNI